MLTHWDAVLAGLAALFVGAIALLLAYEAVALWRREKPITEYVRAQTREHPLWALLLALGIGALAGHFWR